jgi:CRISPR-associated protein Cas1
MKRPFYLFSNGRLRRKHNTLALEKMTIDCRIPDDEDQDGLPSQEANGPRVPFAVESVDSLYLFGEIDINTKLVTFLAQQGIPLFFFDYYGNYTASLYPRQPVISGRVRMAQARHYLSSKKRLVLAREFVDAALFNIIRVLKYYVPRLPESAGFVLQQSCEQIELERNRIPLCMDIPSLMSAEGRSRDCYYQSWPLLLGDAVAKQFPFDKRERRPPSNPLNALISFGNSLCYTMVLRQIYRTALDPTVSFLHEPGDRRYSLSLDLAEIFKPLLIDRAIFKLLKNGEIRPKHFEQRLGGCFLKEDGRKIFMAHLDERLQKTVQHRKLGRHVSYERLIRLECHKLVRHLCDPKQDAYQGFHMWW